MARLAVGGGGDPRQAGVRDLPPAALGEIRDRRGRPDGWGRTFETFLGTVFRGLGYAVEITRHHGDYGADLVVVRHASRTAVQAKRWSKSVGVKAIQEVVAAKGYYGCEGALVVTNRGFTRPARQLARANKVELWDRPVLVERLLAVNEHRKS